MEDFGTKIRTSTDAPASLPAEHAALLQHIFSRTVSRLGFFNLFLWKGDRVVFAYLTPSRFVHLRGPQLRWVSAALEEGLPANALLIIEWRCCDAKI
jgi:hypothetical protein